MSIEIKGALKLIKEIETFDSGFYKRQIVLTQDGQYPNDIPIDFLKDKADILQQFELGQEVVVSVNIRGSEYNGKNYVSLNGWKIEALDTNNAQTQTNPQEYPQAPKDSPFGLNPSLPSNTSVAEFNDADSDDKPF